MNYRADRRSVVGSILALAPVAALGWPVAASGGQRRVSVPTGPVLLRRELERGLFDGKTIRVAREWRCTFRAVGSGWIVDGVQTGVEVDTPPSLEAVARLERARVEDGYFPARMDAEGSVTWPDAKGVSPQVSEIVELAKTIVSSRPRPPAEKAASRKFLNELSNSAVSAISHAPADLFFPAPGTLSETRPIPLPDGQEGAVEVSVSTQVDPVTGLLRRCDRHIVTRLAGDSRRSRESWTLSRA